MVEMKLDLIHIGTAIFIFGRKSRFCALKNNSVFSGRKILIFCSYYSEDFLQLTAVITALKIFKGLEMTTSAVKLIVADFY